MSFQHMDVRTVSPYLPKHIQYTNTGTRFPSLFNAPSEKQYFFDIPRLCGLALPTCLLQWELFSWSAFQGFLFL